MSSVPVCVFVTCPECGGDGEVGVRQDHWGDWDTEPCWVCRGHGTTSEQRIAESYALAEDVARYGLEP